MKAIMVIKQGQESKVTGVLKGEPETLLTLEFEFNSLPHGLRMHLMEIGEGPMDDLAVQVAT